MWNNNSNSVTQSIANISNMYETDLNASDPDKSRGLSLIKVQEKKGKGKNVITDTSHQREATKLLRNLWNWFNGLLLLEAILSFIALGVTKYEEDKHVYLVYGVFFLALIVLNCVFVFYQEHRFRSPDTFRHILPQKCKVIREGKCFQIDTQELVQGDIVKIRPGCQIPADLRIITNHDIKIQQSDINGESDFIEGSARKVENNELEMQHVIYAGSKCLEGYGKGVVTEIGDNTCLGKIAQSSCGVHRGKNRTIQNQLDKIALFVFGLNCFSMVLASLFNIYEWDMDFDDYVSISFGNIPQALALTTTLCLTIVARRLDLKNIVVKRLECLETLSSAGVILCDKTGTLTMNKMTVLNFWFNKSTRPIQQIKDTYRHSKNEYLKNTHPLKRDKTWRIMFKTACLCNNARTLHNSSELEGGAADQALLGFCLDIDPDFANNYRLKYDKSVFNIAFKSVRKYQITVKLYGEGKKCLLMKGAPEVLLSFCSFYMVNGESLPINNKYKINMIFIL